MPCAIGYKLKNTMSENGSVKRGVCFTKDGYLTKNDDYKIEVKDNKIDPIIGRDEENVAIALFNPKREITYCDLVEKGTISFVNIDFRKIVSLALKHNAAFIVLAHNHPSGIALPSKEDIKFTERLDEVLSSLGIKFLDHLIICRDDYVSLYDTAVYKNIKTDPGDKDELQFFKKAV